MPGTLLAATSGTSVMDNKNHVNQEVNSLSIDSEGRVKTELVSEEQNAKVLPDSKDTQKKADTHDESENEEEKIEKDMENALGEAASIIDSRNYTDENNVETFDEESKKRGYKIVKKYQHDTESFCEGIYLNEKGNVMESAGQNGKLFVREWNLTSGDMIRELSYPKSIFGEG